MGRLDTSDAPSKETPVKGTKKPLPVSHPAPKPTPVITDYASL